MTQFLKTLSTKLATWWRESFMTNDERWLSQSSDVVELENRIKTLYNATRYTTRLGGTYDR